ncbi:unnamed protein product, partial [Lymnaea stagnalis]
MSIDLQSTVTQPKKEENMFPNNDTAMLASSEPTKEAYMAPTNEKAMFNEKEQDPDWSKVPFWISQRFLTAIVTFWGFAVLYFQRVNLSIAMVCMIKVGGGNTSDLFYNSSFSNYSVGINSSMVTLINNSVTQAVTNAPQVSNEDFCESMGLKTSDYS